jgi:hypothetical protein
VVVELSKFPDTGCGDWEAVEGEGLSRPRRIPTPGIALGRTLLSGSDIDNYVVTGKKNRRHHLLQLAEHVTNIVGEGYCDFWQDPTEAKAGRPLLVRLTQD